MIADCAAATARAAATTQQWVTFTVMVFAVSILFGYLAVVVGLTAPPRHEQSIDRYRRPPRE